MLWSRSPSRFSLIVSENGPELLNFLRELLR
jgi:hypothetical protein